MDIFSIRELVPDMLPNQAAARSRSPFLDEVRNAIRVRHYRIRTEGAYVDWINRSILFHDKRHPRDM